MSASVVGGIALIRHGVVRATRDVDVVIAPGEGNHAAVLRFVQERRATRPDGSPLSDGDLVLGRTMNLVTPDGEVDLLAEGTGPLTFERLAARADLRRIDGVAVAVCSLADLVALKRIAGRRRDLADLSDLEDAHGPLPDARDG